MSSAEELTLVFGRWLRPLVFVLGVVRRVKAVPISSREQLSTTANHRFGRGSFAPRSEP
jgi:hypothetical protein